MKIKERHTAIALRGKGLSLTEIAERLGVAKSSVSYWVRDLKLSPQAEKRLLTKIKLGQFVAARNKKARIKEIEENYFRKAFEDLTKIKIRGEYAKLLCAIIYWCEGVKNVKHGIAFINSDPKLMRLFLRLFRFSFPVKEEKFKPQLHLHSYHDISTEIDFWSKVTSIKSSQFLRPYIKPNAGKRIREHYRGCLSLRYYDTNMARQLIAFGKAFLEKGA